jgi:cytochrome b6-f complex iron-sulfur subunit
MNYSNEKPVQKTRRDFLKYLLTGGIAGLAISIFYPIISYLKPPKQNEVEVSSVKVGKLSEIEKDSGRIIRFGNKPVILLRTKTGELRALSAVCTHLNCTVQFRKDLELIWCACHNGKYDLNGRNISGPPPRPLAPYRVVVKGDEVFVSKLT